MTGLILLVFIGIIVAYFWNRGRKGLGLPVIGKHWVTVVVVFGVIVLIMWAAGQKH